MIYIIDIETNFKAGNSIKISFIKKTIDQIRFPINETLSLELFRSVFYRKFIMSNKQKAADKVKMVKKLS